MIKLAKFAMTLGSLAFIFTGTAIADPVKERQELMKTVGKNTKLSADMVKGKVKFDSLMAGEAMETIAAVPDKYVTLFPEGSGGGETEAGPKIWTDMAGFKAEADKLKNAALAGVKAADSGPDAFKAAFGELTKTCKSCHQDYRVKKNQ